MLEEGIENITESDSNLAPAFVDHHLLLEMYFNGHCWITDFYLPARCKDIIVQW